METSGGLTGLPSPEPGQFRQGRRRVGLRRSGHRYTPVLVHSNAGVALSPQPHSNPVSRCLGNLLGPARRRHDWISGTEGIPNSLQAAGYHGAASDGWLPVLSSWPPLTRPRRCLSHGQCVTKSPRLPRLPTPPPSLASCRFRFRIAFPPGRQPTSPLLSPAACYRT
jgi:hypothetical protein